MLYPTCLYLYIFTSKKMLFFAFFTVDRILEALRVQLGMYKLNIKGVFNILKNLLRYFGAILVLAIHVAPT